MQRHDSDKVSTPPLFRFADAMSMGRHGIVLGRQMTDNLCWTVSPKFTDPPKDRTFLLHEDCSIRKETVLLLSEFCSNVRWKLEKTPKWVSQNFSLGLFGADILTLRRRLASGSCTYVFNFHRKEVSKMLPRLSRKLDSYVFLSYNWIRCCQPPLKSNQKLILF